MIKKSDYKWKSKCTSLKELSKWRILNVSWWFCHRNAQPGVIVEVFMTVCAQRRFYCLLISITDSIWIAQKFVGVFFKLVFCFTNFIFVLTVLSVLTISIAPTSVLWLYTPSIAIVYTLFIHDYKLWFILYMYCIVLLWCVFGRKHCFLW